MSLRRDVCWDSIVGRGKVSHCGWLLLRRGFTCSNYGMWHEALLTVRDVGLRIFF